MISKVLIGFNNAPTEGNRLFFSDCADKARELSHEFLIEHDLIEYNRLNSRDLPTIVNGVDGEFIFLAASHGTGNSLTDSDQEDFLSTTVNEYLFHSNIVYSLACLSALELGSALVRNGVKGFWGYKDPHYFIYNEVIFIECALEGLRNLLLGNTLDEALTVAKEKYDAAIDDLFEANPFSAAQLLANKEGLTIYT